MRKVISILGAGAAASALVVGALPLAAGAKALPKPTVTSIVVSHGNSETASQIAPYESATVTITGTGFNSGDGYALSFAGVAGKGLYGLLAPTGKSSVSVSGLTRVSATTLTATIEGPEGNNLLRVAKGGYVPGTIDASLTVPTGGLSRGGVVVSKTALTLVSNCGANLPAVAAAGSTYGQTAAGNTDVVGGVTGTNSAVDYFDVQFNAILAVGNLCSDDIGSATTEGSPTWASNYPLTFASSLASDAVFTLARKVGTTKIPAVAHDITGVGFSFPYSSSRTLNVFGTTVTYSLSGQKTATGCSADGTQPTGLSVASCSVSSKGVVTVVATGQSTFTTGGIISSPIIKVSGVTGNTAGTPIKVTPVSAVSEIGLGSGSCSYDSGTKTWTAVGAGQICTGVIFSPRSNNATYAPLSWAVSS